MSALCIQSTGIFGSKLNLVYKGVSKWYNPVEKNNENEPELSKEIEE